MPIFVFPQERLDFSCAMFGPDGGLVANAPHIPVHLGAMQETVQYQVVYISVYVLNSEHFSFYSQIKCWLSELEFIKCLREYQNREDTAQTSLSEPV